MARTYREIAIEDMLGTVQEAMSQVIDWWGDLPPPMKEAIGHFRTQLGAAIDSVEFVKRAHSTDKYTKLTAGKTLPDVCCGAFLANGKVWLWVRSTRTTTGMNSQK